MSYFAWELGYQVEMASEAAKNSVDFYSAQI